MRAPRSGGGAICEPGEPSSPVRSCAQACSSARARSPQHGTIAGDTTCDGTVQGPSPAYITVWFHTGQPSEKQTLSEQVAAFNASQQQVKVKLIDIPEAKYSAEVASAAATGNLPDLLDFDGPDLYNYAWSGKLKPLDSCVSKSLRADLLPSIVQQGTYEHRLYGIGTFDSGLGLYVRPSILHRLGIRIPTSAADAWTASEFTAILHKLHSAGYKQPLDLQVNSASANTVEYWSYGFAPDRLVGRRRPGQPLDLSHRAGRAERSRSGPGAHHHAGLVPRRTGQPEHNRLIHPRPDGYLVGGPLGVRPLPQGVPARPADRAAAALRAAAEQRDGIVAVGHHRQRDGRGRRLALPVLSAAARPGGPDDAGQRLDPGDAERDPPVAELQAGRPRAPLCRATPGRHRPARPQTPAYPAISAAFATALSG